MKNKFTRNIYFQASFFACLVFETGHLRSKSLSKEDNLEEEEIIWEAK